MTAHETTNTLGLERILRGEIERQINEVCHYRYAVSPSDMATDLLPGVMKAIDQYIDKNFRTI